MIGSLRVTAQRLDKGVRDMSESPRRGKGFVAGSLEGIIAVDTDTGVDIRPTITGTSAEGAAEFEPLTPVRCLGPIAQQCDELPGIGRWSHSEATHGSRMRRPLARRAPSVTG